MQGFSDELQAILYRRFSKFNSRDYTYSRIHFYHRFNSSAYERSVDLCTGTDNK